MAAYRKQLVTAAKILISVALLYFIFTKIDLIDVVDVLKKTRPQFLALALLFFVLSKIIAAFRLNLYLYQLQIYLSHISNLKLYLLGMFYNLFLPGGIGGDAYKGYVIKQKFKVKTKRVVAVLLLDRLSGLLLLFVYACVLATLLHDESLARFKPLVGLLGLFSIVVFWWVNKTFFKDTLPVFWKSFACSALVQLAQLISAWFILKALSISLQTVAYLFIFLVSSMVSVIPLTIGGIGSREVTFFYGAQLFGLAENTSVGISMVFFLITAFVSLLGIGYHFKKPELTTKTKETVS
ncbi:flippase-like domain-containing protein [Flavobacteriaceae bacterium TP-CH-4]|uniref:Flippase-like domain-containing protein n=1 Tax=Pelagihabitans pacificus TaxID=2696054 RepID=A0A967APF0_9FLAO|nr:lysylphosphatidylglycerol synthase transmembrane domain-containing protein [Pelagihabitans pacificus]NHF57834.1 flippase-like domain-containing protein [Pelagihabitans pacificus]